MLRIAAFTGEIPRIIPRLLPESAAQVARNVKLVDGSITPLSESRDAELLGSNAQTIYRHRGTWLGWNAVVNAVPGPVATDRLYYTGQNKPKMLVDGVEHVLSIGRPSARLEVRVPAFAKKARLQTEDGDYLLTEDGKNIVGGIDPPEVDPDLQASYIYTYTFVTPYGEESEPAPPSKRVLVSPGNVVRISNFEKLDEDSRVNRFRIYRSQTSASGETDFYLIREIGTNKRTWDDRVSDNDPGEPIPSLHYNPPPNDLTGLTGLPNGMMAGFVGKDLYFCEPYQPHAWPQKYVLTTDVPIVGLAAFGTTLVVLTEGVPYLVVGTAPENMQMEKSEANFPCVSARGIVDLGYSAAYPSNDGLVLIGPAGPQLVTRELFTREQWQELNPSSIVAGQFEGRYIASYTRTNGERGTIIIDLTGAQPFLVRTSDAIDAMHYEVGTSRLFVLTGRRQISQFDDASRPRRSMTWKSKRFVLPAPVNFGAYRVEGTTYLGPTATQGPADNFTMKVYGDGKLVATVNNANKIGRLPGGFKAAVWEVEIEGFRPVSAIILAMSPSEIAMAGG